MARRRWLLVLVLVALGVIVCRPAGRISPGQVEGELPRRPPEPRTPVEMIVDRARDEVRRGVWYDASYRVLDYPGGDVPPDRGACTDVLIRALRAAGCDLQVRIAEDRRRFPARYPRLAGRAGADPSIDHRRIPNHLAYLARHAAALPRAVSAGAAVHWRAGDLVYWKLPDGRDHCGVVTGTPGPRRLSTVVHNMGLTVEEDCLDAWRIEAHYRLKFGA